MGFASFPIIYHILFCSSIILLYYTPALCTNKYQWILNDTKKKENDHDDDDVVVDNIEYVSNISA